MQRFPGSLFFSSESFLPMLLILLFYIPDKTVRRDPANPTWDPRSVPGGILPEEGGIPPEIPPGIMKHPRWDSALNTRWDPANPARNHWCYPASIPGGILPEIIGGISCLGSQVANPFNPTSYHVGAESHLSSPQRILPSSPEIVSGIPGSFVLL